MSAATGQAALGAGERFTAAPRVSVDEYHRLGERGDFASRKVELLEGTVVDKGMVNPPHVLSVRRVARQLESRLSSDYCVRQQAPVTLSQSEPEPDVAVAAGAEEAFAQRHPGPGEVPLVVEVSDSTLEKDRTTKLRVYARDRIPVYWIVNLVERRLEVYTDPGGPADPTYRGLAVLAEGDSVGVTVGGVTLGPIAVADLLPPA